MSSVRLREEELKVEEVELALSQLLGAHLIGLGRAADMQWFMFRDAADREIALHVQCAWRLCSGDTILVTRIDYWRPASADIEYKDDEDDVGTRLRDVQNEKVRELLGDGTRASSVSGDVYGGFVLAFENGWALHCFADASPTSHDFEEYWRLFVRGDRSRHVVVGSNGFLTREAT